MKYNDNGEYKDIYVKSFDTLPVGAIVEFDGQTIPDGWTDIGNNKIQKTSQYIEGGSSLSNEYGTSDSNGYTQEYINTNFNAITEKGSNSNGTYIKYADGTLVQYGIYSTTTSLSGSFNNSRFASETITYPISFLNTDNIILLTPEQNNMLLSTTVSTPSASNTSIWIWSQDSRNETKVIKIHFMVIGRWK